MTLHARKSYDKVMVGSSEPFPDGAGLSVRHAFGLRMPPTMRDLVEFWSVAGRSGTREERAQRGKTGRSGR